MHICLADNLKQAQKVKKKYEVLPWIIILQVFIVDNNIIPRKCDHPLLSIELIKHVEE